MMRADTIEAATGAPRVAAGMELGGFRVQRIVPGPSGRWIATEAVAADGRRVRLWVSARPASADPGPSATVKRLARLCGVREPADLALVAPLAAGRAGDRWYFAQAEPSGPTLAARLRQGPLSRDEAVRLAGDVAGALATLKAFGLPHEHLTPERIRLSDGDPARALLSDYGFASPTGPAASTPAAALAAHYLAPEVVCGGPLEDRGDVYAVASILFECLTGAPPFPYDRPQRVLEAQRVETAPRASAHADVPPAVDRPLLAALRKHPEERQESVGDLVLATQRALGMRETPAHVLRPARAWPGAAAVPRLLGRAGGRRDVPAPALIPPRPTAAPAARAPERAPDPGPVAKHAPKPERVAKPKRTTAPRPATEPRPAPKPAAASERTPAPEPVIDRTPAPKPAFTPRPAPKPASHEPAAKPAVAAGPTRTPRPAPGPRPARTPAPRRGSAPTSERRRRTARTGLVAAVLLALVTGAGFAIGSSQPDRDAATTGRTGAAARPAAAATPPAPDLDEVAVTIGKLRSDRDAGRRALRVAATPAGQAAAATTLAEAYGTARRGLPVAVVETPTGLELDEALGSTDRAYRRLATAAGSRDARAFGSARAGVLRDERVVDDVLARLSTS